MSESAREERRIEIVDYARFAAALGVVAFHYLYNGISNGKIPDLTPYEPLSRFVRYGYLGVDMFFMISGFVIANSAVRRTASRFAVGRVVRLYPTFWVAMTITTALSLILAPTFMKVTPAQFLANLTMVPNVFGQPFIDGAYWTLGYELTFYLGVFLLLLFGLGRRLDQLLSIWLLMMSVAMLLVPDLANTVPLLGGYFLLFGSGAVISAARRTGWSPLRVIALLAGFAMTVRFELRLVDTMNFNPVIVVGISVAMFGVMLSTLLRPVAALRLPASNLAGQLTYPLYLLHAHIGYMLIGRFADESNKGWVTLATFVFVLMLALAVHLVVERRMKSFWYDAADRTIGVGVRAIERRLPWNSTTPRKDSSP